MSASAWLLETDKCLNTLLTGHLDHIEAAMTSSLQWLRSRPKLSMTPKRTRHRRRRKSPPTPLMSVEESELKAAVMPVKVTTPKMVVEPLPVTTQRKRARMTKIAPSVKETPLKPLEPMKPAKSVKPVELAKKMEPEELVKQQELAEPAEQSEPVKLTKQPESVKPESVKQSEKPAALVEPAATAKNTEPRTPAVPNTAQRKRGRPPKEVMQSPFVDESVPISLTTTVQRRRGRPPKGASASTMTTPAQLARPVQLTQKTQQSELRKTPMMISALLSSDGSPMKTPVPTKITAISKTPVLPKPLAAAPTEPKFESWTSRFVKNASFGARKSDASLPIVDIRIPAAPPPRSPTFDATQVELVPPPTVTRRAKRETEYAESPLTRAKRIDAQNTWREQQLKNFFTAKSDSLKSAMETLKEKSNIVEPVESLAKAIPLAEVATETLEPKVVVEPLESKVVVKSPEPKVVVEPLKSKAVVEPPEFKSATIPSPRPSVHTHSDIENTPISEEEIPVIASAAVFDFEPIPDIAPPVKSSDESLRKMLDPVELEKRRRLKERNDKALLKRKQMLEKAQQIKSNNYADLSGKPKEVSRKISNLPCNEEHCRDEAIRVSQERHWGVQNATTQAKIAINSSEDELMHHRTNVKENRPIWANTPDVAKSLLQQRSIKPEDIFGDVQPVKLEGNAPNVST
ncbi:hypothetical protein PSACC_02189 [Paramicrosporidium saccamoebae]|uniref:Inner centromere protein ARK-binding domain-containing protein n=1 Tax=Paramicrosporidium saccamoebae TaxID=1246581 RepID=A0A2H9TJT0_9FUNG|nr:hypothetical protein PSACC_02189 [Paramicrosporidium saccamoebae]